MSETTEAKVKVRCTHCDRSIRVNRSLLGRTARCPACGEPTRLGEAKSGEAPALPISTPKRKSPVRSTAGRGVPAEDSWLDGLDSLPDDRTTARPNRSKTRQKRRPSAKSTGISAYGWQIAVGVATALLAITSTLPEQSYTGVVVVEAVFAAIIVGLLFLPRSNAPEKSLFEDLGEMKAKVGGTLGVIGLVVAYGFKSYAKYQRRRAEGGADLSSMSGAEIAIIATTLAVIIGLAVAGFWLRRRIGGIRVAATGYILQAGVFIAIFLTAASVQELPDAPPRRAVVVRPTRPAPAVQVTRQPDRGEGHARRQWSGGASDSPSRLRQAESDSADPTPASQPGESFFGE